MSTHRVVPGVVLLCVLSAPLAAAAFCGFYVGGAGADLFNNATKVVLMRDGTLTVLSMQNDYQGPPEGFAMVVPVPVVVQKNQVKTLDRAIFDRVDRMAAPRLVEYWEVDPCWEEPEWDDRMVMAEGSKSAEEGGSLGVTVEASFAVGEYEIVVLSAEDSSGLETWLKQEKYAIPDGAEPLLRPYVAQGSRFFVARVDPKKVKFVDGRAELSPLRVHYDSERFSLPIRLGMINSSGTQDLIVHILARNQRYRVANYPNVTIPTNLEVGEETKARFGEFYAALFDATVEKHPGAVVTEYSWDAGSCDPCPGPTLSGDDMMTLGADVLDAPKEEFRWGAGGFVLTRLHARYGKGDIARDLEFEAAPPIVGGREFQRDGKLEKGSAPGSINNFQGRYIIRHPWTGKLACSDPVRGRWGGPTRSLDGGGGGGVGAGATNTAFAKRGELKLASVLREDIPELEVTAALPSVDAAMKNSAKSTGWKCGNCALSQPKRQPGGVVMAMLLALFLITLRRGPAADAGRRRPPPDARPRW